LNDYTELLRGVWERQWLTNKGPLHDALEQELCAYLRVSHLSLVSSGTIALMLALRAFDLAGEAITTPFTSPATVHAISWCGLTPVFADIDPRSLTLDPAAVERAITPRTVALVPVHVFGVPCAHDALQEIASRYGLRLIYDGAHAFGAEVGGKPLSSIGDATMLSFHATKLFNTAEGGAVVAPDREVKRRVDLLRDLGFENETTFTLPGLNGKMSELAAALGLANLPRVEAEHRARGEIAGVYRERLSGIQGLSIVEPGDDVHPSRFYFAIRVDGETCRRLRDDLYAGLRAFNVFPRRYFYPLCTASPSYCSLPSAAPANVPVATRAAAEVLCLPFYGALGPAGAYRICDMIEHVLES
jgi:dTDP-4-amino-4,6-dideoxygalactose transaminase